jgi:hypothetical protein
MREGVPIGVIVLSRRTVRLQDRFGIAANTGNLLRCIGRLRSARNVIAPSLQNRTSKVGTSHRPDYRRHAQRDTAARSQR